MNNYRLLTLALVLAVSGCLVAAHGALHEAARLGHVEVVRALLEVPGVNVNAVNNYAVSVLQAAQNAEIADLIREEIVVRSHWSSLRRAFIGAVARAKVGKRTGGE